LGLRLAPLLKCGSYVSQPMLQVDSICSMPYWPTPQSGLALQSTLQELTVKPPPPSSAGCIV
jgi:hypothetical protein